MAIIRREIRKFKKGQIVHLDEIIEISAFVQVRGFSEPYRNKYLKQWDADTSDEYKIVKDFVVEIIVRDGNK